MKWPWITVVVASMGCRLHFDEFDADPSGDAFSGDGFSGDAFSAGWSSPQPVDNAHALGEQEQDPALASDASELYFVKSPIVAQDIFVMTRLGSTWSVPAVASFSGASRSQTGSRSSSASLVTSVG